jgi:multiple RNA-binding domain-containing protein 1
VSILIESSTIMSRIIVKGLPPTCTDDKLRAHFASSGTITDCKVAKTKDGKSRQFAFIGFKESTSSEVAIKKFNKTFMGQSRLSVESALELGSKAGIEKSWSKFTKEKRDNLLGKNSKESSKEKSNKDEVANPLEKVAKGVKDKAKLEEFLALSKPANTSQTWINDDVRGRASTSSKTASVVENGIVDEEEADEAAAAELEKKALLAADSSDDEYTDILTGTSMKTHEKEEDDMAFLRAHVRPSLSSSSEDEEEEDEKVEKGVVKAAPTKKIAQTIEEVARARSVASDPALPVTKPPSDSKNSATFGKMKPKAAPSEADMQELSDHGRLFLRNLAFTCTEADLRAYFGRFGPLASVKVVTNPSSGLCVGYAYVQFHIPEQAVLAFIETDGKVFQGRLLHVLPSAVAPEKEGEGGGQKDSVDDLSVKKSKFQQQKEAAKRKEAASGKEGSIWNTLFVRSDAALGAVSARLGVSSREVLLGNSLKDKDKDGDGEAATTKEDAMSAAVRLAHAETQLIQETKAFLEQEGVSLPELEGALEAPKAKTPAAPTPSAPALSRSDSVILVKNLPYPTSLATLRDTFSRYGVLLRCVMPPSCVLALVEFLDPACAKRAFAALAYSRFERVPLYLEWAPVKVFRETASAPLAPYSVAAEEPGKALPTPLRPEEPVATTTTTMTSKDASAQSNLPLPSISHSLFVKNVSFDTKEETLVEVFKRIGPIRSLKIPRKRNPKFSLKSKSSQPEFLSLGYAFVEYEAAEDVQKAIRKLQGEMVDGHSLQLKVSLPNSSNASDGIDMSGSGLADSGPGSENAPVMSKKRGLKATSAAPTSASATAAPVSSTKLLVRNLAFEATKKDLVELFKPYGQVKTVRLPKKFNGSHRGFAFIEFLTHAEAASAMQSLASTHLYGRHVVLEWSTANDDSEKPEKEAEEPVAPAKKSKTK